MSLFSASNLSKSYNDSLLFENINFGMEVSERVSIIGRNGVGKTTFLKIIAGVETPDTGIVGFNREYSYEFLEQLPQFQLHENVLEAVMNGKRKVSELINLSLIHISEPTRPY